MKNDVKSVKSLRAAAISSNKPKPGAQQSGGKKLAYVIGFLVALVVVLVVIGLVVDKVARANRASDDDNAHPYLEEEDAERRREND